MAPKSAEIRTGIVILAGLFILALGIFYVLGGSKLLRDKVQYTILFKNAGGLKAGDDVTVAGRDVGEVVTDGVQPTTFVVEGNDKDGDGRISIDEFTGPERIWPFLDPKNKGWAPNKIGFIEATVEVWADAVIYTDSKITISATVTGSKTLEIEAGSGQPVKSDGLLFGETLRTFAQTIDIAGEAFEKAGTALTNMNEFIVDFRKKDFPGEMDTLVKSLNRSAAHIEEMTGDAKKPVRETLRDLRESAREVRVFVTDINREWTEEMKARVRSILRQVDGAAETLEIILKENQPNIKAFTQDLRDIGARVVPTIERIENLVRNADEAVIEVRPKLTATLEHARRAMRGFEATIEDLRTSPWKLVNKPSDKETDAVALYNATRLYVDAVGEVSAAVSNLETLRQLGALKDGEQAEKVNAAVESLEAALKQFNERQDKLVGIIVENER